VGYCSRVGRNLIRLELKKLYEGIPAPVTRHWHKFAVEPPPAGAYPGILYEPNIGKRAKALTYAIVRVGENLATLAQALGLLGLAPDSLWVSAGVILIREVGGAFPMQRRSEDTSR
jgi:hypothetical protein